MSLRHIGSDFDNTIVCYDDIFFQLAFEEGLIPSDFPHDKVQIRDHLRAAGKEDRWTVIQGLAYGSRMCEARAFPGSLEFFAACKTLNLRVSIVSHRSRQPYAGEPYDLHAAALAWLQNNRFLDYISLDDVSFKVTRDEKVARITEIGCSHFIDDLPEVLSDRGLPADLNRILFDPEGQPSDGSSPRVVTSWAELRALFGV
jgi:hypothetical protein